MYYWRVGTALPPGGVLTLHRAPYAGSLRYHLGLVTPNDDNCAIIVDGQRYSWRDGEEVVFDETYLHWAENKTDKDRIILFCDIERPIRRRSSLRLHFASASPCLCKAERPPAWLPTAS